MSHDAALKPEMPTGICVMGVVFSLPVPVISAMLIGWYLGIKRQIRNGEYEKAEKGIRALKINCYAFIVAVPIMVIYFGFKLLKMLTS